MHKSVYLSVVFSFLFISSGALAQTPAFHWKKGKAKTWLKKGEWLGGLSLQPHSTVDAQEFAWQYHTNKAYWDQAFAFLKEHDLQTLAKGKYPIDGDNVFATVTETATKDFDSTQWESHRKYIDLQYVISGEEKMGVCKVLKATVTKPYDAARDVANYSAKGKIYSAVPGTFFLFFPMDAHRPNITPGGKKTDKKIVIKVRTAT